ncbi:hypothetical protein [Nocardioides cavernaquae]|uniref:hypothetical protein n=1 Tax=Nocardioides cavernaquae TaxID=2321396 RepID=UPI0011C4499B|nr:hypothetical protein [Nocardioides cavernaquae]
MRSPLRAADVEGLAAPAFSGWDQQIVAEGQIRSEFGADARLLGWLMRLRSERGFSFRIPGFAPHSDDDVWADTPRALLTESLSGVIASRLASQVLDASDRDVSARVMALQKAVIGKTNVLGNTHNVSYLIDDNFEGLGRAEFIDPEDEDFSSRLADTLDWELKRRELVGRDATSQPSSQQLLQVRRFLTEALENTQRHATRDLAKRRVGGVRFLAVRRHFIREIQTTMAPKESGHQSLSHYLTRAREQFGDVAMVEFTVADSGIGISAHHRKDLAIYSGSIEEEFAALQSAFGLPEANMGWEGLGLPKIQDSCRDLRAFLMVRTGRILATQHQLDTSSNSSDLVPLTRETRPLPFLAGTSITIVVPWVDLHESLF